MENIVLGYPLTDEQYHQICTAARDAKVTIAKQEELPQKLMEATIFCGHAKVPVDWDAIVAAGNLHWIQSSAAGLDHCLQPPVVNSNVEVSGCSGLFANQVAEQAMAILLGLIRSMRTFYAAQQQHVYTRRFTDDLCNKSVGIIGLGGNGQRIAQVIKPFVPRIVGTDIFADQKFECVDEAFPDTKLVEVLNQSDVVIVTLPLTPKTHKLIGRYELDAMRPDAYLINVGRGSVIDTEALIKTMESDKLSGIGIDVVDPEPLPKDSPLWDNEKVVITPHVGAQSRFRLPDTTDFFCENIRRKRAGQTLMNLVDKQLGFPRPEHRVPHDWRKLLPS